MFHGTNQSQDKKVQSKIQDGNLSNMVLGGEYSCSPVPDSKNVEFIGWAEPGL